MPRLDDPVVRLYVTVYLLLVLKMAAVGTYTSILRLGRRVYATPEDYAFQGLARKTTVDEDVERVRRAHRNDLENILPFFVVGFCYLLTGPSWNVAAVYLIGYLVARVARSRPGASGELAIHVRSYGEVDDHLGRRWCACGGFLERTGEGSRVAAGRRLRVVRMVCQECERVDEVFFDTTDVLH